MSPEIRRAWDGTMADRLARAPFTGDCSIFTLRHPTPRERTVADDFYRKLDQRAHDELLEFVREAHDLISDLKQGRR
jgi:hypothetical protein